MTQLRFAAVVCLICALGAVEVSAQVLPVQAQRVQNRPLPSLAQSVARSRANPPPFTGMLRQVPNKAFKATNRTVDGPEVEPGQVQTSFTGGAPTQSIGSFDGINNDDNGSVLGYRVSPPDTDGDIGWTHFVQMVNSVTAIYDRNGAELAAPFASNAFWTGFGGVCEQFNRGDPIVLYDEKAHRWLVSQFAFTGDYASTAQCVAVSQSDDPLGAYNRYAFDFSSVGFPDYPKHGITTNSITVMINLFTGSTLSWGGTYLGAIDKNAMYDGLPATLVGRNLGTSEFGFVAGDLDDVSGNAGFVPALFATAMSRTGLFDVWEVDPDFLNQTGTVERVAGIGIDSFSGNLCTASREACIPQPSPGTSLEALSDRLMHRLQVRDFGSYKTMVASHTINVGSGRAGVRWYEMRDYGSGWSFYQSGTYAPNDGLNRWIPSIAMNATGDIGLGYMVSNSSTFPSIGVAGQSAGASGSGLLDSDEVICRTGNGVHTGSNRSGDYSATKVDPLTDEFWHTNEYVVGGGNFDWDTGICQFAVTPAPPPPPATAATVSNMVLGTISADRGQKFGTATLTVVDDNGTAVGGALVTGQFTGNFDELGSGSTGGSGSTTIQTMSSAKLKGDGAFGFCVLSVDAGTLAYSGSAFDCGAPPPPPEPATEMRIVSVSTGSAGAGRGRKVGKADVTVQDENGNPVAGVTVTGNFSGDIAEIGAFAVTGSNGVAGIRTSESASGKVTVSFCATSVTGGSLTYAPGAFDCSVSKGVTLARFSDVPEALTLDQNYPNPFNPTTVVPFALPEQGQVQLRVYSVLGQEVAVLVDGVLPAGSHRASFDASSLAGGIYLYVLETPNQRLTGRMTLLK